MTSLTKLRSAPDEILGATSFRAGRWEALAAAPTEFAAQAAAAEPIG